MIDAVSKQPTTTIASVKKALRILSEVARSSSGATASDVARALGLPLPTTYHLLNTLTEEAALTKAADRRYRLGPRIGALSAAYFEQTEPDERALAPMRWLAEETGETAYLSGWRGADIEVLASAEGRHAVRVAGLQRGTHGHAHARASGKLLLAHASETLRSAYLSRHDLTAVTPNTITSLERLEREFEQIRSRGYAVDGEEFVLGVACVSAPIVFDETIIGAYTVTAPVERFRADERRLTNAVIAAAERASGAAAMAEAS